MKGKSLTIILSVLFSILLWVFISLSGEYFYKIKAKVVLTDLPKGFDVADISDREIEISIRGKGFDLVALALKQDLQFSVSLKTSADNQRIQLKNMIDKNTWLSSAFIVDEINPSSIRYNIDRIYSKKVKVVSDAQLNFKSGYNLISDIVINPDTIEIQGAKSFIERITEIKTERKIFNDLEGIVSEKITLIKPEGIRSQIDFVNIEFEAQQIVDKSFYNIPVDIINVPADKDLQLFPGRIEVVLRGGILQLGKIKNENINVYITYEQALNDAAGSLLPIVEIPERTTLIRTTPERIEYIIKKY